MKDLKAFRLVNEIETRMIYDSLIKLSPPLILFFKKNDYRLYISLNELEAESKFPSIFLIFKNQSILLEKVLKTKIVRSAGVYFGFIKKGVFFLSLEGAEFLHKLDKFPINRRVVVNEKEEKSILYGNNILKKMVRTMPLELKKNDFLAVFNQNHEIIAISRARIDSSSFKKMDPNNIVALNLLDKGYYLRKKQ